MGIKKIEVEIVERIEILDTIALVRIQTDSDRTYTVFPVPELEQMFDIPKEHAEKVGKLIKYVCDGILSVSEVENK